MLNQGLEVQFLEGLIRRMSQAGKHAQFSFGGRCPVLALYEGIEYAQYKQDCHRIK